jgi:AraC-like DNA-binding protein
MEDIRSGLVRTINFFSPREGLNASPLPGVYCIKFSHTDRRSRRRWRACLGIVAQGCKEIVLERDVYHCDEGHYTATPVDLPVVSRIASASPEKPFLAMLIDLGPKILTEVSTQLSEDNNGGPVNSLRAIFIGKASDEMLEAAVRLGRLFHAPNDARVLGPLIVRELIYHLLKGADGNAIRHFVRSGSKTHIISQCIYRLQSELHRDVDVTALAKAAKMSRSAFFEHFKAVTAMSPIQYQKRLRLLEARRLMVHEGETAEGSAFKVGYKSAPQFSREYSRMFGNSPLRDAMKLRTNGNSSEL